MDPNSDPWVLRSCTFTGAAILLKASAAYYSTSIAASADRTSRPPAPATQQRPLIEVGPRLLKQSRAAGIDKCGDEDKVVGRATRHTIGAMHLD